MTEGQQNCFTMHLRSVGVVRSDIKTPAVAANDKDLSPRARAKKFQDYYHRSQRTIAELIIDSNLEGILDGIEDFSHIIVLYWPHLLPSERRKTWQVHPMGRKDIPLKGVFATCSPARPNPQASHHWAGQSTTSGAVVW